MAYSLDTDAFHYMSVAEHHAVNAYRNGACCASGFLGHDCGHSMLEENPTDEEMLADGFVIGPDERWVEVAYARERSIDLATAAARATNILF